VYSIFFVLILIPMLVFGGDLLEVGANAPDFELKDGDGKTHKLSDYNGKKVVLYFYPKNNTAGCTAEACNLRDNFSILTERGVVVLGISYDNPRSHKAFASEYNLPFPLLADTTRAVAEAYGTKGGLLGMIGPKRITYLIDEEGKVMHVFRKVDTDGHAAQILAVLNEKK